MASMLNSFLFFTFSQFLLDLFLSASFKSYHDEGLFFISHRIISSTKLLLQAAKILNYPLNLG